MWNFKVFICSLIYRMMLFSYNSCKTWFDWLWLAFLSSFSIPAVSCSNNLFTFGTNCITTTGSKVLKSIRVFWLWRSASVLWTMIRSIFLFGEANLRKCSVTPLLEIQKLLWSLVYPQMLGLVNTHLIPWDMQTGTCFPTVN